MHEPDPNHIAQRVLRKLSKYYLIEGIEEVVVNKPGEVWTKLRRKDWEVVTAPEIDYAYLKRVCTVLANINGALFSENETIKILSNQNLTETEKYNQFTLVYNSFDPILLNTAKGINYEAKIRENLEIFDRVGGGDSFNEAKEKFQEVQQVSPMDSEYYLKATEKLKDYLE